MKTSTKSPILSDSTYAILYGRVSTDQQDASLAAQEGKLVPYASTQALTIVGHFTDSDVSGTVPIADRPGGSAVVHALRAGLARHLVVAKLDRLGRNCRNILGFLDEADQLGVTVHFVDLGGCSINTQSPFGRFMLTLLAAVSELEVGIIRQRTLDVLASKRASGWKTSHVPYGKRETPGGRLEDHPEEMPWLLQMIAWRHVEGLGFHRIAQRLNASGAPTKTPAGTVRYCGGGKVRKTTGRWSCGAVSRVLGNKFTEAIRRAQSAKSNTQPLTQSSPIIP